MIWVAWNWATFLNDLNTSSEASDGGSPDATVTAPSGHPFSAPIALTTARLRVEVIEPDNAGANGRISRGNLKKSLKVKKKTPGPRRKVMDRAASQRAIHLVIFKNFLSTNCWRSTELSEASDITTSLSTSS